MKQQNIKVPFGIKYMSDWKEYKYPRGHCIVDKGVTGCGYTEYCLRNDLDLILCSPRKILLENKEEKHLKEGDINIIYLRNEISDFSGVILLQEKISEHIVKCKMMRRPVKFMITYDSTHYLLDHLEKLGILEQFVLVADEFQSIFLDSYFKVKVENDFLKTIQRCNDIIYLSATPMLDKYLNMLDEFKDLDFYSIDWSNSGYVENIQVQDKRTRSLSNEANKIIKSYLKGDFPIIVNKDNKIIKSKEAVFYFNSVTEIIRIIKKNNLKPEMVNILCSDTEENKKKLNRIKHSIGKIPLESEPNKMFTFCTSTCYIGADFYSKCASTYIFADPNLECLALDISLDLPQIAGRQRDRENPFKNNITLFYKTLRKDKLFEREEFDLLQKDRVRATNAIINLWNKGNQEEKIELAKKIESDIIVRNYVSDYACMSEETGEVTYNKLIEIANERAWEVSQEDYRDTICVTKALEGIRNTEEVSPYKDIDDKIVDEFLYKFYHDSKHFHVRLKLFCSFMDKYKGNYYIYQSIRYKITDVRYNNYYQYFGTAKCSAADYRDNILRDLLISETNLDILTTSIYNIFKVGERYLKKEIKEILSTTYEKLRIVKAPKASDLKEWFEIKNIQIYDPLTKKRDHGFEIIRKK